MSDITPERIAEHLRGGEIFENRALAGYVDVASEGAALRIGFTPKGKPDQVQRFGAVVLPGEAIPIVLEHPAELGLAWDDGGDLLSLTSDGILFNPRGVDEWDLDPAGARELAAHLAAMADAYEAAQAEQDGGQADG